MLFITVKYIAPTTHKCSRVKAYVKGNPSLGSHCADFLYSMNEEENYKACAQEFENQLAAYYGREASELVGWGYTSEEWLFVGLNALKQEVGE